MRYYPTTRTVASTTPKTTTNFFFYYFFFFIIVWLSWDVRHVLALSATTPAVPDNSHNNNNNNNIGKQKHRRLKQEGRSRRIEYLLTQQQQHQLDETLVFDRAQRLELESLQRQGDPFDATLFDSDHISFKANHNRVFVTLAQQQEPQQQLVDSIIESTTTYRPVLYLDGPDGGSTRALLDSGFVPEELYTVNEWPETVQQLQCDYNLPHCYHGRLQNVLQSSSSYDDNLSNVSFVAVYLDGCSGQTRTIIDMISALLHKERNLAIPSMVIGFTLTKADPTGRELIDRIQDVTRIIFQLAKNRGYHNIVHVGDDPERFGILNPEQQLMRQHDGISTTWVYLEKKEEIGPLVFDNRIL